MFGVEVEAELEGTMIYIVNTDTPGFIGKLGTALGEAGINIATFNLGRREARRRGGRAGRGRRRRAGRRWCETLARSTACARSCRCAFDRSAALA